MVLGEGTASLPPHQLGGLGSAVSSQRGPGGAPAAEVFCCILCHLIASTGISVYSFILAVVCGAVHAYMIAEHFSDSPYIHRESVICQ